MPLVEIDENIYLVQGMNRGRYPYANGMLIQDRFTALVDTGMGPEAMAEVADNYRVDLLIISHGHEDHYAANHLFPQARVAVHRLDAPALRSVERLVELYGAAGTETEEPLLRFLKDFFNLKASPVDLEFEDGHIFDLGTVKLKAIHTPGHSAGHCCFSVENRGLVFLGDIDLSSFGPFYGCLDSDIDSFLASIARIQEQGFETALSGHKEPVFGRETLWRCLEEYGQIIFEREEKLLNFLQRERSLEEIVEAALIYRRFPEPADLYALLERNMISKHLERLLATGKIVSFENNFMAI